MPLTFDVETLGKPLPGKEAAFAAAIAAMKNAIGAPISSDPQFWLVNYAEPFLVDAVSLVNLRSIGMIARAMEDWGDASQNMRLFPIADAHALRDVLEALMSIYKENIDA